MDCGLEIKIWERIEKGELVELANELAELDGYTICKQCGGRFNWIKNRGVCEFCGTGGD